LRLDGFLERTVKGSQGVQVSRYRYVKAKQPQTFDDKRALLMLVFAGRSADGKRHGVYVNASEDAQRPRTWKYRISGQLVLK
jgi:hypothetical protein